MKNKKWLSLALAGIMLFASGCGKNKVATMTNEELSPEKIGDYGSLKLPLDDKNTKISILVTSDGYNLKDSVVVKELEKRTGLDLDLIPVAQESINQKVRVLIASKNSMPDIFGNGFSIIELNDFGMQGAFEPINNHFDELPNFSEIFINNTEKYRTANTLDYFYASNGDIYSFPTFDTSRYVNHGILYRKDIFDKHGIEMWNNPEEFYQTMKKLKELYPSSTPFVSKNAMAIIGKLGTSWGLVNTDMYYNEKTGVWKYSDTQPETKEILDLLKKMYSEGLIDPEFLTATQSAWTQKMVQYDKAFVTFDWIGRLDMFEEQTKDSIPEYDLRYGNPIGPRQTVKTLDKVYAGYSFAKSENSLLAMKLCDFLLSPAGAQLATIGIEGETFEINSRGKASFPELGGEEKVNTIDELGEKYGLFQFYMRADKRASYFDYTEREKEAQEFASKPEHMEPLDPQLVFTNEEIEIKTEYLADLKKATEEFYTQYIMNESAGDKEWNEWLKKAESLGVSKLEKVYNDAQARYNAM